MIRATITALALLPFTLVTHAQEQPVETSGAEARPRNVILIIGDGMDDQQITIARNYLKGMEGELLLDGLPMRGVAQVLAYADTTSNTPVYVADSANTATSMATGEITSRGRISTSPGADQDITTIIELAEQAGYRTGLVTTSSVTDATPAAFAAHVNVKWCIVVDPDVDIYDPADVLWALTTRVDWSQDAFFVPGAQGHEMDPTADARGVQTKIGVDATSDKGRRDYEGRVRYQDVDLSRYL